MSSCTNDHLYSFTLGFGLSISLIAIYYSEHRLSPGYGAYSELHGNIRQTICNCLIAGKAIKLGHKTGPNREEANTRIDRINFQAQCRIPGEKAVSESQLD